MRMEDMPTPGFIINGFALVREAKKAIDYASTQADLTPDSTCGSDLRAFFLKCAKACPKPIKEKK